MKRGIRIATWIALGLCLVILLSALSLVVLLRKPGFREYVARNAHERILNATGFDLRFRDFALHLKGFSPTVDLYDVVVQAAAPYDQQPLVHVDHLSVAMTVVSLLHRNWYLDGVVLNHPIVRVVMDKDGRTNIPQPQNAGSPNQTNIFDLGIRQVHIDNGEIYYNDNKDALQANLRNLQFQSKFDPQLKQYSGALTYRDGVISYGTYKPLKHDLDAQFDVTADRFQLKSAKLISGKSQLDLAGSLGNYANPEVQASYQALLDSSELRSLMKDDSLPSGVVRLAGSAQYQMQPNRPALESISLEGNLNSDGLLIDTPNLKTQVSSISGRYSLHDGDLDLSNLSAGLLGGNFRGTIHIHDVSGTPKADLQASIEHIGLRAVQAIANPQSLRDVVVSGTASGNIQAHWTTSLADLSARADGTVRGAISPAGQTNGSIPLDGTIHSQYSAAAKQLTFSQSVIRMPQTSMALNGTVSSHSTLQVQFDSKDLHEVETAASVFSPALYHQHLGLHGTASFSGTVRGWTDNPEIQGQFSATDLHVRDTTWQLVRGTVTLTPSEIIIRNGEVVPANQGHLSFNLTAGLNRWTFSKSSPIQLSLNGTQLDVAELKSLAGIDVPLTGTLSANVLLHGSVDNPVGQGSVSITPATISNEPVQTINASFQGDGTQIRSKLMIRLPAGIAQGDVEYFPKQEAYETNFTIAGLHLDQLQNLKAHNIQLQGVLNLQASGNGTIKNPSIQLTAQVPALTIQNQTINDLVLQADVANHVADVDLNSQAMNTYVKGHGVVNLRGDYNVDATFDTSTIALQPIIAAYSAVQSNNITGQAELHASVKGPLKDRSRIEAHITIPTLAIAYKNDVQLGAANPVKLDYSNSVLTIERTEIQGADTDLQVQGSIPVKGNAPASILLLGTVDLKVAELISPDISSSGKLRFNINTYGQTANPNVQGQVQLVNANFAAADLPFGLENANGQLSLNTTRLQIQRLTASVGGGNVQLSGGVTYRPNLQYDLAVAGRGIRFHVPDGVREGVDADLSITGNKSSGMVQGQVRVNEVSFARDFDFSTIAALFSSTNTQVPNPFLQTIHLNVGVQSTSDLNLVSSTLSLQGATNLRVQGSVADPVLLGRVNVTGGDVMFRGARYEVQPSTVAFVNPYHIEPQLNANVDTSVEDYKLHLQFRGTLDRLRTTYTSEPPLPEADVINLLVFGKTTEEQATNPTPGNIAAESAIASAVSSQVTGRIQRVAGISQISIDPALQTNNQTNAGTRITVQQRVTGTVFVTFSADVSGTQREIVKLEYQYSPRLSVVGVRDENGGFALDFRIHNTW